MHDTANARTLYIVDKEESKKTNAESDIVFVAKRIEQSTKTIKHTV